MKIEGAPNRIGYVKFSEIPIGKCFEFNEELLIKTTNSGTGFSNTGVCLDTGSTVTFEDSHTVKSRPDVKIVVEPPKIKKKED